MSQKFLVYFLLLFLVLQNLFTESYGVKKLSEILALRIDNDVSESNDKLIEVVLSILGNCTCNNEASADQVSVIKKITRDLALKQLSYKAVVIEAIN